MPVSAMVQLILKQLLEILAHEGAQAHFVGGSVRDLLLGRTLHDLDLVVAGEALPLARTVANAFHGAFVPLDEENGMARAVLRGREDGPAITLDFARLRGEDLPADLAARDFTVNSIAMAPAALLDFLEGTPGEAEVIDPWGGQADLQAGLLRALRPQAFQDDPLRTLRAVRLAAELHFRIDLPTAAWIRQSADLLQQVSAERIRDELARLLACAQSAPYLALLQELELLPQVFPDLQVGPGNEQPLRWESICGLEWLVGQLLNQELAPGDGPFWQPAARQSHPELPAHLPHPDQLRAYLCKRLSAERSNLVLLKLALVSSPSLGQDAAAAANHRPEPGTRARRRAQRVGHRLRLSRQEVQALSSALPLLVAPQRIWEQASSQLGLYRLYRDGGEIVTGVLLLALAHELAQAGPNLQLQHWQACLDQVARSIALRYEHPDRIIHPPPLLDGHDLMETLGLNPGRQIGDLLESIREAQAAGQLHSREQALDWARQALEGKKKQ